VFVLVVVIVDLRLRVQVVREFVSFLEGGEIEKREFLKNKDKELKRTSRIRLSQSYIQPLMHMPFEPLPRSCPLFLRS